MDHHQQLRQLALDHQAWKLKRPYKTAPIPTSIKEATLSLSAHFSIKEIARALQVASASITQWLNRHSAPVL